MKRRFLILALLGLVAGGSALVAGSYAYRHYRTEWLIAQLESEFEDERKAAAEELGRLRCVRAISSLLAVRVDDVRTLPILGAVKVGGQEWFPSESESQRHYTTSAIVSMGPAAVPELLRLIDSSAAEVATTGDERFQAIASILLALDQLDADGPTVRKSLIELLLRTRERFVAALLIRSLATGGEEALRDVLDELPRFVNEAAPYGHGADGTGVPGGFKFSNVFNLADGAIEFVVPDICQIISDRESPYRRYAILALRNLALSNQSPHVVPRVVPLLLEAARDSSVEVRTAALEILGAMKSPDALPLLQVALKEEARDIRWAAVQGLGYLHSRTMSNGADLNDQAYYLLNQAASEDPDPDIRKLAMELVW